MDNHQVFEEIKNNINNNDIVLYMKGTAQAPQCGFSSTVVNILRKLAVEFKDVDILADDNLREAIKTYSDWPTIPQLYIKSEFIGGCDIVREMYSTGELQDLLKSKNLLAE